MVPFFREGVAVAQEEVSKAAAVEADIMVEAVDLETMEEVNLSYLYFGKFFAY